MKGPLPGWLRWFLTLLGFVPLVLLVIAGCLTPDPSGSGTHERLGLPPCMWQAAAGIPCPACGMTTSWSLLMRGQPGNSLAANPAGTTAALISVLLAIGLLWTGWTGRWSAILRAPVLWICLIVAQFLLMILTWLTRLL